MPLVEPTVVIGHEEEQDLLSNTGIPAAGYVVGLRRKGRKLHADLSQIFPDIARLIEAGAYKHVSAEIYPKDRPPEGVPAVGCMLRRVALLGGQLPHIKSLSDLPPPGKESMIPDVPVFEAGPWQGEYYSLADLDDMVVNFNRFSQPARRFAEYVRLASPRLGQLHPTRRVWQNTSRTWACFSEVRQMADSTLRDAAVGAIKASHPDLSDDFLASLSDEQLAMLAAADTTGGASGGGEGEQQMQDMPSREQMIADLVALGEDQAALEAMTDEDLMRLWQEKKGATMAEPNRASTAVPAPLEVDDELEPRGAALPRRAPKKVTTTQQFSEADLERIVTRVADRIVAPLRQDVARRRSVEQAKEREALHGLIRAFSERMVKEGHASPAEMEIGKDGKPIGPQAKALFAADAVKKFSEGKTALQLQMEAIEARPVRKFGELVQDPVKQAANQMSQERRDYLLSLTGRGKAVLAKEEGQKQNARLFAEALAGVVKQISGNGHAG
jgi:hypothetical protein